MLLIVYHFYFIEILLIRIHRYFSQVDTIVYTGSGTYSFQYIHEICTDVAADKVLLRIKYDVSREFLRVFIMMKMFTKF